MTDLKTTFAGLSLRNPIIISSSGLTNSVGKNKKLAENGAGAIVLKSLFESAGPAAPLFYSSRVPFSAWIFFSVRKKRMLVTPAPTAASVMARSGLWSRLLNLFISCISCHRSHYYPDLLCGIHSADLDCGLSIS